MRIRSGKDMLEAAPCGGASDEARGADHTAYDRLARLANAYADALDTNAPWSDCC